MIDTVNETYRPSFSSSPFDDKSSLDGNTLRVLSTINSSAGIIFRRLAIHGWNPPLNECLFGGIWSIYTNHVTILLTSVPAMQESKNQHESGTRPFSHWIYHDLPIYFCRFSLPVPGSEVSHSRTAGCWSSWVGSSAFFIPRDDLWDFSPMKISMGMTKMAVFYTLFGCIWIMIGIIDYKACFCSQSWITNDVCSKWIRIYKAENFEPWIIRDLFSWRFVTTPSMFFSCFKSWDPTSSHQV